jgi:hypothetical protein
VSLREPGSWVGARRLPRHQDSTRISNGPPSHPLTDRDTSPGSRLQQRRGDHENRNARRRRIQDTRTSHIAPHRSLAKPDNLTARVASHVRACYESTSKAPCLLRTRAPSPAEWGRAHRSRSPRDGGAPPIGVGFPGSYPAGVCSATEDGGEDESRCGGAARSSSASTRVGAVASMVAVGGTRRAASRP